METIRITANHQTLAESISMDRAMERIGEALQEDGCEYQVLNEGSKAARGTVRWFAFGEHTTKRG